MLTPVSSPLVLRARARGMLPVAEPSYVTSKGHHMQTEPVPGIRRPLASVLRRPPARARTAARRGPSPRAGPTVPIPQTYAAPRQGRARLLRRPGRPGRRHRDDARRAHDARGGDRAGRERRRDRDARRDLPDGRPAAEPGHHAAALRRRAPGPQGHPGGDRVAGPAQQRVADVLAQRCSRPGRSAGGSAAARACERRCTASTTTWSSSTASC